MVEPGRVLAGRYILEQPLGEGGMGQVWVARHKALDKIVAVKLMTPEAHASAVLRARFEREAKACAQLRSAHVVQVFDYGVEDDMPYLVMELLEGSDLSSLREQQPIWPLREVASIVAQTCKGLSEAHEAGIVHRDIKLSNLFIAQTAGERVLKILDFGIAKAFENSGQQMTGTNVQLGSPSYMSPEQVMSRAVDARADLWSLGVVAFRLLTGQPPFKAESSLLVAQKIIRGHRARASDLVDGLPHAIDAFFDEALAVEPSQRFQTAEELSDAFDKIATANPEALARTKDDVGPGTRRESGEAVTNPTAMGHEQLEPRSVATPVVSFAPRAARTVVLPFTDAVRPVPTVVLSLQPELSAALAVQSRRPAKTVRLAPPDEPFSARTTLPLGGRAAPPPPSAAPLPGPVPAPQASTDPSTLANRQGEARRAAALGARRTTITVAALAVGAAIVGGLGWWGATRGDSPQTELPGGTLKDTVGSNGAAVSIAAPPIPELPMATDAPAADPPAEPTPAAPSAKASAAPAPASPSAAVRPSPGPPRRLPPARQPPSTPPSHDVLDTSR